MSQERLHKNQVSSKSVVVFFVLIWHGMTPKCFLQCIYCHGNYLLYTRYSESVIKFHNRTYVNSLMKVCTLTVWVTVSVQALKNCIFVSKVYSFNNPKAIVACSCKWLSKCWGYLSFLSLVVSLLEIIIIQAIYISTYCLNSGMIPYPTLQDTIIISFWVFNTLKCLWWSGIAL